MPPDDIWDDQDALDDWFDRVFERKEKQPEKAVFTIYENEIEG